MSELAMPGNAYLDRAEVPVPASEWQISPVEYRDVATSQTGESTETLARNQPGHPWIKVKRRFRLRWPDAGESRRQLERLAAVPGVHRLVLWRREWLAYQADGARSVFHLPAGWTHAYDQVGALPGVPTSHVTPEFDIDGGPLSWAAVDDATFDGAAPPPAGTVWTRTGGSDFRLETAPPPGSIVYAGVIPEYSVLRRPLSEVQLNKFNVEPATLDFQEV